MFRNLVENRLVLDSKIPLSAFFPYVKYLLTNRYWIGSSHKMFVIHDDNDKVIYTRTINNNILITSCTEDTFFLFNAENDISDVMRITESGIEKIGDLPFNVEWYYEDIICSRNKLYTVNGEYLTFFHGKVNQLNDKRDNISILEYGIISIFKNGEIQKAFSINSSKFNYTGHTHHCFEYQPDLYTLITCDHFYRRFKKPIYSNYIWDTRYLSEPLAIKDKYLYWVHDEQHLYCENVQFYMENNRTSTKLYNVPDISAFDCPVTRFHDKFSTYDFYTSSHRYRYKVI